MYNRRKSMKEVYNFMALQMENDYTVEDLMALPDDVYAELIDGQIYYMDIPSRIHQELVVFLLFELKKYIDASKGSGKAYLAPFGVYFEDDKRNYFIPDISVICDTSKLTDIGCNGAPDLIMEIVSPSGIYHDYSLKHMKYQEKGVREYWIIDPLKKRITVWNFPEEQMSEYSFTDKVPVGIYPDFFIDFSTLEI